MRRGQLRLYLVVYGWVLRFWALRLLVTRIDAVNAASDNLVTLLLRLVMLNAYVDVLVVVE